MNEYHNPPTIEDGVRAMLSSAKENVKDQVESCRSCIRRKPGRAILFGIGAGYLLHRLPVRALLVTQVKLLAALAPPAMLAFGAAKLGEFLQGQSRGSVARAVPENPEERSPGHFQDD